MKERKNDEEVREFKIRKGVDLIRQYEKLPKPKVLWNGIIEGATGLITGVAKTGKTTFAENLAISLAVGKSEFFGHRIYGEIPKRVLFLNLEEKLWRIGRRNKCQLKSLNERELELFRHNYFTAPDGFPSFLNYEYEWKELNRYISEINPDIIFLDSLTHMCIGEIEKSAHAQDFIQKFKEYILTFDKTVFVIHHNTKGNDRPMTQDNIAGSRVITQEFDFAIGFGNIPSAIGGTYSCMLYNKDSEKNSSIGRLYDFDSDYWVREKEEVNIYHLYNKQSKDGRISEVNKNKIYDFIKSQTSQVSPDINSKILTKKFVETSTMSKQTFYNNIDKLIEDGLLTRNEDVKGEYRMVFKQLINEKGQ